VGKVAEFAAALENLFLAIAKSGVLEGATSAIQSITSALISLGESSPKLLKWGTYAMVAVGVLGPLGILLGGVSSALMMLSAAAAFFLRTTAATGALAGLGAGAGAAAGAAG